MWRFHIEHWLISALNNNQTKIEDFWGIMSCWLVSSYDLPANWQDIVLQMHRIFTNTPGRAPNLATLWAVLYTVITAAQHDTCCLLGKSGVHTWRPALLRTGLLWCASLSPSKCWDSTFNLSMAASISSPIHYLLIVLPFNYTQTEVLTALLNTLKQNK